jgi:predicted nucleic acid-binding protein
VARILILDSDPSGLACHGPGNSEAGDFRAWMYGEWVGGTMIVIPEIVDYEVRRSLILAGAKDGIDRLDDLYTSCIRFLPINTAAMKQAADLWARARLEHRPTAGDQSLDADVILSAQSLEFCSDSDDWRIITENVDHIERYVGHRAQSRRVVVQDWLKSSKSFLDPDQ